jgi:hypothetical protein
VGKHNCFLAQVASGAAPTASRRDFGKEKGAVMKFATVSRVLVVGLALLLASTAFAGTKASLSVTDPVTVNGTTLKAGDYKLMWDGTGPNVEVSIMQGRNLVTKVPAKVVDLSTPATNNSALVTTNSDGSRSLSGARFEGKKYALEIGGATDGAASAK